MRRLVLSRLRQIPSWAGLAALAGLVEIGLRTFSLPGLCALLGIRTGTELPGSGGPALSREQLHRVTRWSRRVDSVVGRGPARGRCLRRSLMLGYLVRDLEPTLRIGVARHASTIEAHAWLEVAGEPLAEPAPGGASDFVTLAGSTTR